MVDVANMMVVTDNIMTLALVLKPLQLSSFSVRARYRLLRSTHHKKYVENNITTTKIPTIAEDVRLDIVGGQSRQRHTEKSTL